MEQKSVRQQAFQTAKLTNRISLPAFYARLG